jgi:hypothetical protein
LLAALLVGAGSVGGAAIYTLAFEPAVTGHLDVYDPQALEPRNPYRAVLATATASAAGAAKVDEVKAALAHHTALTVTTHAQTLHEWECEQPEPTPLPLVLVAVDSRDAREEIQDALPLDVVNAAVGNDLITVSAHRTGAGACMCCLHMRDVLDATRITNRLIAAATGIDVTLVNEMRVRRTLLERDMLRRIAGHRGLAPDTLSHHAGATLDELWTAELLYGETEIRRDDGTTIAVAAPVVTALAGVLLGGEALQRSAPEPRRPTLGVDGAGIQYCEDPYAPQFGYVTHASPVPECLCRSARRVRHLHSLYGLDARDED